MVENHIRHRFSFCPGRQWDSQVFGLFRERYISNISWRLSGEVCKAIPSTPWPQSVPFSRDWNMLAVHHLRWSLARNLASPDFYYLNVQKTGLLMQLKIHQFKQILPNMNKSYLNILKVSSVFGRWLPNFAMKLGSNEKINCI